MKTPCEWTIKCSSSTDRIMFQTIGSMYRRAQSTGRYGLWSLYDPNDNNKYLGKTSFSHDQMVLLPHQSGIKLTFISTLSFDPQVLYAYVSCFPHAPITRYEGQNTTTFSQLSMTDSISVTKGLVDVALTTQGTRRPNDMNNNRYYLVNVEVKTVAVSGNDTVVKAYDRNGKLLKTLSNNRVANKTHHVAGEFDGKGFLFVASAAVSWNVTLKHAAPPGDENGGMRAETKLAIILSCTIVGVVVCFILLGFVGQLYYRRNPHPDWAS